MSRLFSPQNKTADLHGLQFYFGIKGYKRRRERERDSGSASHNE